MQGLHASTITEPARVRTQPTLRTLAESSSSHRGLRSGESLRWGPAAKFSITTASREFPRRSDYPRRGLRHRTVSGHSSHQTASWRVRSGPEDVASIECQAAGSASGPSATSRRSKANPTIGWYDQRYGRRDHHSIDERTPNLLGSLGRRGPGGRNRSMDRHWCLSWERWNPSRALNGGRALSPSRRGRQEPRGSE
jgi:hypothetical protein